MKTLIVDDEALNRQELKRLVEEAGLFEIAGEAASGKEALRVLKQDPGIRVVFLDVDMPGMSGLEVARTLADWPVPPFVVFATAYDQYAIQAFEASAVDYLLKPYDPERFEKTVERIERMARAGEAPGARLAALEKQLAGGEVARLAGHKRNSRDRVIIEPEEVFYFRARYAEVCARLADEELIVNGTLREILEALEPAGFARTHKAYVVNLDKVKKISPMFSGNFQMTLDVPLNEKIPLSRRYAREVKQRLRW